MNPSIEYSQIAPAIIVFTAAIVGVLVESFAPAGVRAKVHAVLGGGAVVAALIAVAVLADAGSRPRAVLAGSVADDGLSLALQGLLLISTLPALALMVARYDSLTHTEAVPLTLFALGGMLAFVSAQDWLTLFVALEVFSLPLYLLCALAKRRGLLPLEAALKYFLMGAFATGILLFGMALLYGATGTFYISAIGTAVAEPANASLLPMLYIGILLMIIGLGFKVSAAPFHFWTPDVYEGTPTFFTAFMSTVVKTAGFAAFLKLLAQALPAAQGFWMPTIVAMGALTLLLGNIGAAVQNSAKRMLAYSSVSHAGYLFIGLVASNGQLTGSPAASGIFFYSLAYSIATVLSFGVLKLVADQRHREDYTGLNGLAKQNPLLAFTFTVSMLSLAGIPLTGGFLGKFFIFAAAVEKGYIGLVVFAVVMSMVSIYYYLKPVIAMYLQPADETAAPIEVDGMQRVTLVVLALLTILLGTVAPVFLSGLL